MTSRCTAFSESDLSSLDNSWGVELWGLFSDSRYLLKLLAHFALLVLNNTAWTESCHSPIVMQSDPVQQCIIPSVLPWPRIRWVQGLWVLSSVSSGLALSRPCPWLVDWTVNLTFAVEIIIVPMGCGFIGFWTLDFTWHMESLLA